MYQFKIYTEKKSFQPSRNELFYSSAFICSLPLIISLYILKLKNIPIYISSLFYITIAIPLIGKILRLINRNNYRPLNGVLNDTMTLEIEKISINETEFELSKIKKIEFLSCWDYKGLSSMSAYRNSDLNNPLSNGVRNTIKITMENNVIHIFYFQQLYKREICNAKTELINYYLSGKLHFLNLIDTLGISDYEEIQNFKATLSPTAV